MKVWKTYNSHTKQWRWETNTSVSVSGSVQFCTKTGKHSSRMRTARLPTVHASVSPPDVSTSGGGVLKWTSLNRSLVELTTLMPVAGWWTSEGVGGVSMSDVRRRGQGGPMSEVGGGGGGCPMADVCGSMYSEVQCIMGNGHIGSSPPPQWTDWLTDRHVWSLPSRKSIWTGPLCHWAPHVTSGSGGQMSVPIRSVLKSKSWQKVINYR